MSQSCNLSVLIVWPSVVPSAKEEAWAMSEDVRSEAQVWARNPSFQAWSGEPSEYTHQLQCAWLGARCVKRRVCFETALGMWLALSRSWPSFKFELRGSRVNAGMLQRESWNRHCVAVHRCPFCIVLRIQLLSNFPRAHAHLCVMLGLPSRVSFCVRRIELHRSIVSALQLSLKLEDL